MTDRIVRHEVSNPISQPTYQYLRFLSMDLDLSSARLGEGGGQQPVLDIPKVLNSKFQNLKEPKFHSFKFSTHQKFGKSHIPNFQDS